MFPTIEDGGEDWVGTVRAPDGRIGRARMAKSMFTHAEAACVLMLALGNELRMEEHARQQRAVAAVPPRTRGRPGKLTVVKD